MKKWYLNKITSILHHITDVHKWDGNKFVNAYEHDDLLYMQRPRKWLQPNSHDHRLVAFKYKSKRNHFSYDGVVARTILSILDFNNNTGRSRKGFKLKYSLSH
ncbi:hypothetical protein PR048_014994 [Dryococelus australis]|uniref:Uncharacterized protein n=1 Tax=Dryococelus australis TaxID=614101 RepID=A0ABQ9HFQ5_9NEOP|nr:hypothetical protein PR048_014994 [Dryococelus australis]